MSCAQCVRARCSATAAVDVAAAEAAVAAAAAAAAAVKQARLAATCSLQGIMDARLRGMQLAVQE